MDRFVTSFREHYAVLTTDIISHMFIPLSSGYPPSHKFKLLDYVFMSFVT